MIFNIITIAVINKQIFIFLGVLVKIGSTQMFMNQHVKAKATNVQMCTNGTISVQKDLRKIV